MVNDVAEGCFKQKRLRERNECLLLAVKTRKPKEMRERQRIRKHANSEEE